jgi:hypothetical protein
MCGFLELRFVLHVSKDRISSSHWRWCIEMRELALATVSSATFYAETGRSLAASARAYFAAQFASPISRHR